MKANMNLHQVKLHARSSITQTQFIVHYSSIYETPVQGKRMDTFSQLC